MKACCLGMGRALTSDSNGLNAYTNAIFAGLPYRAVEVSQVGRATSVIRSYN